MTQSLLTNGARAGRVIAASLLAAAAGTAAAERTVPSVIFSFGQLAHHPDPMAVGIGVGDDASLCMHYQGINRYDGPDGTPYLFISRSGNRTSACALDNNTPGELAIARLDSRPRHGERLRPNRLMYNVSQKDTPPPASDRIVRSINFDGVSTDAAGQVLPPWMHLGGMQIIDDVLVIPVEDQYSGGSNTGALLFFDLADPENPLLMHSVPFGYKIGVVAITKEPDTGKYLIAVSGGSTETIRFFRTATDDLTNDPGIDWFDPIDIWDRGDSDVPNSTDDSWEKWQTINFVRQDDGQLFLVGVDNTSWTDQTEGHVTKLYLVTESNDNFNFTLASVRHLKLDDPRSGNGAAGSGVYISPMGELMMYTCEHDNDGPQGSIRAGEIRSYNVSTYSGGLDMSSDYWIELYWDDNGWNESSPNRSLMLDENDFAFENWEDLDKEDGWGDAPDSLRFYAPPGRDIILFKGRNYTESAYRLTGNGQVQSIPRLDDISFGDAIHSVFIGRFRVPAGAEVFGQFQALRTFSAGLSYSGSRALEFIGGANLVVAPLEASPGETVFLTTQRGTSTLLVGQ